MDFASWHKSLDTVLKQDEDRMFALLADLVGIDSPTLHARGVNAVASRLEEEVSPLGFHASRFQKPEISPDELWQKDLGDPLMVRSHDAPHGPGIAFIGHMDTVFPVGTAASRKFHLDKTRDVATGPGVADMKAGLVAMVYAAKALKQSGLLKFPITLMFSADEELGSPISSKALAANLPGAKAVLCAEPGGIGGKVTVSRKGSGHMRLSVQGKSAHAGRNYGDGASAILAIAHKILAVDKLLDLSRGRTVNTGMINGGISANSIAPGAEAAIHLTYRTMADGLFVVDGIRKIAEKEEIPGTTCKATGGLRLYPLERSPQGDELFGLVKKAGECLGIEITGQHYESAAESGFCSSALSIPAICCMGPEGENIHSVDEYMRPSTLMQRTKLIALSALAAASKFR